MTATKAHWTFHNAPGLISRVLRTICFDGEPPPIPSYWKKGRDPLIAVLGENAAGKSFFRRVCQAICRKDENKVEFMGISMELRQSGGPMNAFVFGSESYDATGAISAKTVLTGIKTCRSRENPHVMCWDEPDLGLSDNGAAGVGLAIREFAENPGKHTKAIIVTSHSRALVSQLVPLDPHMVYLGEQETAPRSLDEWLARPIVPRDLTEMANTALERFRTITKLLKE
jgi:hypothetical protein